MEEHHYPQEHSQGEADLTETPDPKLYATYNRSCSKRCDRPNDDHLVLFTHFNTLVHSVHSRVELDHPQSETRAHPKHRANNGENVDDVTKRAKDLVTNQGVETGAHGHWKVLPEGQYSQQQTDERVHDPSMNAPVKHGQVQRILGSLIVVVSDKNKQV